MLNISRQIYVGKTSGTKKYHLDEAEIIPHGESAGEKKKLQNFTAKSISIQEFENIPLPGFTLYSNDRKKWGSVDNTWLVIDPRGFLSRITNDNLETILAVTGITEGLIQEKCVWARDDSQTKMSLVPISSTLYAEATKNTEMLEDKVKLTDVQIGDTVHLQNGLVGIFRGVLSLYGSMETEVHGLDYYTKAHLRRQVIEVDPGRFFYQANAKILKITDRTATPMTREESAIEINKLISGGNAYFSSDSSIKKRTNAHYGAVGLIKFVSVHAVTKPTFTLEEIDKEDTYNLITESLNLGDATMLAFQDAAGKYHILEIPYIHTQLSVNSNCFSVVEVLFSTNNGNSLARKEVREFWGQSAKTSITRNVDNYEKFYKIIKHVKTDSYI